LETFVSGPKRSKPPGQADFSKIAKGKQEFNKSVLSVFTQEFSFVVHLHVGLENEPKKLVSANIFGSFGPTKKNSL